MARYNLVRRSGQPFESGTQLGVAGITHRDRHIAQEPGIASARDWRTAEQPAEFFFTDPCQILERRRKRARLVYRICRKRCAAIPGADVLADVAAEDVGADCGAVLLRHRAAQLDREVRDAETGI